MAKSKVRKRGAPVEIHVISRKGDLDQKNSHHLSLHQNERAKWISDTGTASTIYFNKGDGSPFEDTEFHVPAGGEIVSGPLKTTVSETDRFNYTVVGRDGTKDPVIIIDN